MNTIFNDNTYFENLQNFNYLLKRIAKAEAVIKHLAFRGVPEGSVMFNNSRRRHVNKSGSCREYVYTNVYLYIDGVKYYISKKMQHLVRNDGRDLNDYTNPANHLFLLTRFWMRRMAREVIRSCSACAKGLAKLLNAIKSREIPRIKYEEYKFEICENFAISEENQQLAHQIDDFFDLPLHKQLNLLDLRPTMDCDDNMNFDRQFGEKLEETVVSNRQKKRPRRLLCKFRGSKISVNRKSDTVPTAECGDVSVNVDLRNVFDNSIINDFGEQVRSKNEVIALRCAHDCGLCYELEPYYPGSDMRADIGVRVRGRKIYVEFAGWRDNPKYEERLREKIEYAHEHNLSLVIIDMTAYPGKDGKNCMKMNYIIICRIFLYLQLGLIREGIFLPY